MDVRLDPADRKSAAPLAKSDVPARTPFSTSIKILTCGSVDDGKSTLIGRLLWDAADLPDDQRTALVADAQVVDGEPVPDFSRLLDGLLAEREQGITIDVAWRYFDTSTRRIVVIDSPGHEQYTRNMASGASHADVAILLVDARHGIKRQTRRHAAILDLMGVRRVVLAVNKMDLVAFSQERFSEIARDFDELAGRFQFEDRLAIPLSAVLGANVTRRSDRMAWYAGPTLIEHLESLPGGHTKTDAPFRMPVQLVLRDGADFRGLAGSIASGSVRVGDTIVDTVSGGQARVARIATFDTDLDSADAGAAVVIGLDRDLDISRGAVLASRNQQPVSATSLEARLVWLGEEPLDGSRSYALRTATDFVPVASVTLAGRFDPETLDVAPAASCAANDIVEALIRLRRPTALEPFGTGTDTGAVLLVDRLSGATVAGGTVASCSAGAAIAEAARGFVLSDAILAEDLCRDLGATPADLAEFARRRRAVIDVLQAAGVVVDTDIAA